MRIKEYSQYNQPNNPKFTSILPVIVEIDNKLCTNKDIRNKVMEKTRNKILNGSIYDKVQQKFRQFIPKINFIKYLTIVEEPTNTRDYLGYFFTDETALKVKNLKNHMPEIEQELFNNSCYRATAKEKPIGLHIYAKSAYGLSIDSISFNENIPETTFKAGTCIIA